MNIASVSAGNGLQFAQASFNQAAARISSPDNPVDTVSLSSNVVDLIQAKNQFEANIQVMHLADEMQKTTLSLIA
jgi:flagellar basal body rod protein FlgF